VPPSYRPLSPSCGLGLVLLTQSQYEEALPNLKVAVKAPPAEVSRLIALAQSEVQLARLDDVRSLRQIENLPEGRAPVPNERYSTAVSYLEKALAASPPEDLSRALQMGLGVAYSQTGRYNEAAAIFQKLLKSGPESFQLHFNLGTVYGHLQRYTEAVPEYQKALELNPNDDNTRLGLAHWQGTYPTMVQQLEKDLPELLSFFSFPRHLWRQLRTTNVIEPCFSETSESRILSEEIL